MTEINEVQPFPDNRWHGFQMRVTKAVRNFTKRWKQDRSGFRVDGKAVCFVEITLYMRGNGELIGYTNPQIRGLEPRSYDWVKELDLESDETLVPDKA